MLENVSHVLNKESTQPFKQSFQFSLQISTCYRFYFSQIRYILGAPPCASREASIRTPQDDANDKREH